VACDQATRLDPNNAFAYANKGVALDNLQRYEEALAACDQAIRLDPNNALAYNGKASILIDLQRYEEALVAFEQAIRLDSNNAFAYNGKGSALEAVRKGLRSQLERMRLSGEMWYNRSRCMKKR